MPEDERAETQSRDGTARGGVPHLPRSSAFPIATLAHNSSLIEKRPQALVAPWKDEDEEFAMVISGFWIMAAIRLRRSLRELGLAAWAAGEGFRGGSSM